MSACPDVLGLLMQIRGAEALHVPVVVTEQYPAGLGHTVVELRGVQPNNTLVVSKTAFTMLGMSGAVNFSVVLLIKQIQHLIQVLWVHAVPEVQSYLSKHPKIKQARDSLASCCLKIIKRKMLCMFES